jgi:hypothetical protein
MNADEILTALDLPISCRLDRRVPKKLLLENGAPTAADKRRINEGIEEFFWIAALKPTTIGVPEYLDAEREYLEIAVLRLIFRTGAKATRLLELVHRAVPYPLILIAEQTGQIGISAAHKRWAQNEAGKTVLDGEIVSADCDGARDAGYLPAFFAALALGRQPLASLYTLYQGWIDILLALKAARVTGVFGLSADTDHAAVRREALREYARLDAEIARLRAAAAAEKQMPRQVELNMEVKRMEAALAVAKEKL